MLPRTLPARIVFGFVLMIAFAILLGGVSLWRIMEINRNVEIVATNSVPSIVALTRVIQSTYDSTRAVRRMLLATTDGSPSAKSDDMGFKTTRSEGDEACKVYTTMFADPEEERLFAIARSARESYLRSVERVVALLHEGKADEARALMRDEVDGFHDACITAFNEAIRHNVGVASENADEARRNVARSFGLVGGTLALAMLLGALLAAGIIRSTTRALGGVSAALESTSTQTSLAASQLATSSHALAEGCSEQGSAVEETSAALEQMSAMIRATSDNADKAKLLANQARGAAQGGLGTMQEMNEAMEAIETSSQEVAKIVRNIDEIAFQTNILALNAAVEAARAGEAGAGFAVVADEVRSLAQRSAAAAQETARKIEAAIATSRRGAASCDRVGESLEEITRRVSAVDGLVAEIATAAKEQAQGIQQVTVAMAQMDQVTQGNSASAEQSAGAAEQLKAQSHVMRDTVASLQSLAGRREARRHVFEAPAAPVPQIEWRAAGVAPRQTTRIPMPKEPPPAADHEDRHFRNF